MASSIVFYYHYSGKRIEKISGKNFKAVGYFKIAAQIGNLRISAVIHAFLVKGEALLAVLGLNRNFWPWCEPKSDPKNHF